LLNAVVAASTSAILHEHLHGDVTVTLTGLLAGGVISLTSRRACASQLAEYSGIQPRVEQWSNSAATGCTPTLSRADF
jgi:hypothetical protein